MKALCTIIGLLVMVVGVLVGLYVALWWGWVGGIVQVIEAAKLTPVDAYELALGIVRILFANFLGAIAGWLIVSIGAAIGAAGQTRTYGRWR